jgi:pyruvate/2-oxoacid:ferredoxin oxidoreductase beta subunit
MVESFKPLEDSEEKNRKIKILDIEIKFPSSDKEGPEYAKRLEELIKDMDLPEDYLNIIKASLIIAKSR